MNEVHVRIEEHEEGYDEPCYVISIAARMVGMHAQTLRQYERLGLVSPKRSQGNIRLYSRADVAKLKQVQRLVNDLGVNLAGVDVILRMSERMQAMEAEMEQLRNELQRLRDRRLPAPRGE
ncbi:MAG TPA: helix-turn-helix transcriptional regulator [Dehalococcoidia bacterium]|nr:helix-turn-helix transcriptional regulator [Dehalococcoidia bacterium]